MTKPKLKYPDDFVFCSGSVNPLAVEKDDRRFMVCEGSAIGTALLFIEGSKNPESMHRVVDDMRNMSFALTIEQIRNGSKTVTRRIGWMNLKPGDMMRPVKKCMGLKPGEKIEPLRGPLRVVSVRRESLWEMFIDREYGKSECAKEGFPDMEPFDFIDMFCASHKGCERNTEVTRIEFEYVG